MKWSGLRGSDPALIGAELMGADLSEGQLNSIDLTRANLYSANLRGAEMHGAILSHANAKGAVFQGADLRRADLRHADLSWADLAEADLRGAKLTHAQLDGARLRGARYSEATELPAGLDPTKERMLRGEGGVDVNAAREAAEAAAIPVDVHVPPITRAARRCLGELRRCGKIGETTFRRLLAVVSNTAAAQALYGWLAYGIESGVAPAVGAAGTSVAVILGVAGMYGASPAQVVGRVATDLAAAPIAVAITKVVDDDPTTPEPADSLLASGVVIGGSMPIDLDYNSIYGAPATDVVDTTATMVAVAEPAVEEAPTASTEPAPNDATTQPVEPVVAAAPTVIPSSPPVNVLAVDAADADPVATPSVATPAVAVAPPADTSERDEAAVATAPPVAPVAPAETVVASAPDSPDTDDDVMVASAPDSPDADDDVMVAMAPAAPVAVPGVVDAKITAAVDQWRGAWESRDVDGYLDLYHPQASAARTGGSRRSMRSGQFSKVNLQARVANMFSEYGRIEVNVENLAVSREGDLMVSTFDQDLMAWRSDSDAAPDYVDHGRRTLVLAQDAGSDWRIVSEQWKPTQ